MTDKEFVDKFLEVFTKDISKQVLKKYRVNNKKGFLWNLFAAKLVPCLDGDDARREYDRVDKTEAIEIQYDNGFMGMSDKVTTPLAEEHNTASCLDKRAEFYVVGKDFSWCYVVTHEGDLCGPYFCYAPRKVG